MSATVYGAINFGLTAQTGMYAESVDWDYQTEEFMVADADGDDTAGAIYNPSADFTMSGFIKNDESLSATLGATLTLTNLPTWTDWIPGYTSGGQTIVTGGKSAFNHKSGEGVDVSGKFKPFLEAAA